MLITILEVIIDFFSKITFVVLLLVLSAVCTVILAFLSVGVVYLLIFISNVLL